MAVSASAPEIKAAEARRLERLRKRRDFLLAARGRKWTTPGFVLQARRRRDDENVSPTDIIRIGYTASKKVGGAVHRNRAKRRLRALAEPDMAALGRPGWDYVLIARAGETASRAFTNLQDDLRAAVERIHQRGGVDGPGGKASRRDGDAKRRKR